MIIFTSEKLSKFSVMSPPAVNTGGVKFLLSAKAYKDCAFGVVLYHNPSYLQNF